MTCPFSPVRRALAAAGLCLATLPGFAQTSTSATFSVTATVQPSCTVVGGGTLAFGLVSPGVQADSSLVINTICTVGTPYQLALDPGLGAGATVGLRRMTSGGNTLDYQLYHNAARNQPWGDGSNGTTTRSDTGTGTSQSITVYGRVPSNASAAEGNYADTVTVTATF